MDYIGVVLLAVFLHDALALWPRLRDAPASAGSPSRDRKAITFEVGIRNAGLGLGAGVHASSTASAAWRWSPAGGASGTSSRGSRSRRCGRGTRRREPRRRCVSDAAATAVEPGVRGRSVGSAHGGCSSPAAAGSSVERGARARGTRRRRARGHARDVRPAASVPDGRRRRAVRRHGCRGRGVGRRAPRHRHDRAPRLDRERPAGSRASSSTASTSTGTRNVLDACVAHGVTPHRRVVERRGLRLPRRQPGVDHRGPSRSAATRSSPTAHHKRLVEEMLAGYRTRTRRSSRWCCASARSSGRRVDNQITALFDGPRILRIRGSESPVRLHLGRRRRRRDRAAAATGDGDRRASTSPATDA